MGLGDHPVVWDSDNRIYWGLLTGHCKFSFVS